VAKEATGATAENGTVILSFRNSTGDVVTVQVPNGEAARLHALLARAVETTSWLRRGPQ
jgi:hypothetical protein